MAMLDPKIDSRALVIKQHTAQVQFYGLGSFLLLPLQPCSTINHKHFVGVYRTHQAFTAMQHSTDPPRPDDSQDLVLNCSVYCQMSNRSDGNTTLHTMSHRYMNGGMDFFFFFSVQSTNFLYTKSKGGRVAAFPIANDRPSLLLPLKLNHTRNCEKLPGA